MSKVAIISTQPKSKWQLKDRYYSWAMRALWRDNFTCVDCDGTKNVVVHHIDESRKRGVAEMNNDLSNLVSLCRPCHARRHGFVHDHQDIKELREMGLTFQQIANKLGLSRQRVHYIYTHDTAS